MKVGKVRQLQFKKGIPVADQIFFHGEGFSLLEGAAGSEGRFFSRVENLYTPAAAVVKPGADFLGSVADAKDDLDRKSVV